MSAKPIDEWQKRIDEINREHCRRVLDISSQHRRRGIVIIVAVMLAVFSPFLALLMGAR